MGRIIIVGGGIIGLYTASSLTERGMAHDITVIADHLPGDSSIEYTSPIAGAHFSSAFGGDAENIARSCRISYPMLRKVFAKFEGQHEQAGLERSWQIEYFDEPIDAKALTAYRSYLDNFEEITDKAELASRGAVSGMKYSTFNFFTPKWSLFLKNYLEQQGVIFRRAHIDNIADAPAVANVKIPAAVFNCTGVMAPKLQGVHDPKANYPIRGQVVCVRAPWVRENISIRRLGHEPTYIIPRPYSNGRVILGGYYDAGDYTAATYAEQTKSIIARTTASHPDLSRNGPLEISDERAGLRPGRDGGPRIERENINGLPVIHNYGAGGIGIQCGLGMCQDAIDSYFSTQSKS